MVTSTSSQGFAEKVASLVSNQLQDLLDTYEVCRRERTEFEYWTIKLARTLGINPDSYRDYHTLRDEIDTRLKNRLTSA